MKVKGFKLYICCCMLMVLLLPAARHSSADSSDDMPGSTLPAGSSYIGSSFDGVTLEPKNVGDGVWHSIWKTMTRNASLQVKFPESVQMKAVQVSTGGALGQRSETYTVQGLQNGNWVQIGKKTYSINPQEYIALAPIPVTSGWYDGIRLRIESTKAWILIGELEYISDLQSPSALKTTYGDQQLDLTWKPVSGAEGYQIRYGSESGVYTDTLTVSADTYAGLTLPGLENGHTYYFVVAALKSGTRSNYSNEVFNIPVPGFDFPDYTTSTSNGAWYLNPVTNTTDKNMTTTWRHFGDDPKGDLYYEFFYPLYISELQVIVSVKEDSDLTYTVFKGRGSGEQILAQQQIHLEGADHPVVLDPFPVTPGWYDNISVRIQSSTAPIYVNEVRYNTDHTPVQNVKVMSGNAELALTWDPIADADNYQIVYGTEYGDLTQAQTVTVSADAYTGYSLTGLTNNGSPYYILIQAVVDGEPYGYSNVASGTPRSYSTGDFLPLNTQVTASGSYSEGIPAYAADRNLRQGWVPESGQQRSGTINFAFAQPIDIYAVQPVTSMYPPGPQHYTIYGLKGKEWILLYDGQVQVPYNPTGGIVEAIPVTPGKYNGLMLMIDSPTNWVFLQELLVFYNGSVNSVLEDTYGQQPLPTVGQDTYR